MLVTFVMDGRVVEKARYRGNMLPAIDLVPHYKAWAYLPKNERAVKTGRQMYYMDASGANVRQESNIETLQLMLGC